MSNHKISDILIFVRSVESKQGCNKMENDPFLFVKLRGKMKTT